jgi:hypothetical protein
LIKEPDVALSGATSEQLDTVERLIGPIEDKLLALDELVEPEAFSAQLENRKHTKKAFARYGRLLASRRMQAGQRRSRFEAIATHLLTVITPSGQREPLPPERAKAALEALIGGMSRRVDAAELEESLQHLHEMLARLGRIASLDEFFDGFFLDLQGYKVSMRDKLSSPEFVYLTTLVNARMANRVDAWVAELERNHDPALLTAEGAPRERTLRRLREQEDEVDDSFGAKRRPRAQAARAEPAKPVPPQKRSATKSKSASRFRPALVVDRQLVMLLGALLAIAGASTFVAFKTGSVGKPVVVALNSQKLGAFSPLLVRGWLRGSGDDRLLDASVRPATWQNLEARKRSNAADRLMRNMAAKGVKRARITTLGGPTVIEIANGVVTRVQGGKL